MTGRVRGIMLERPSALEGKETLSAEEAAAFEASERTRLNRDLFDPESGAPSAGYQSRATRIIPIDGRGHGPLFEYACHEGNVGMHGIMAGARQLGTQRVESTR